MTEPLSVEVEGLDELLEALETAPELVIPLLRQAMTKSVLKVQEKLSQYPPSTEANQPGRVSLKTRKPMGYYERGRGWWYPLMRPWAAGKKLGKAQGALKASATVTAGSRVKGYRLAAGGTSEMLGKSWTTEVTAGKGGVLGEIGTNTSYAPWVQGDQQTSQHAARGWVTVGQALAASTEEIEAYFLEALVEWIKTTTK